MAFRGIDVRETGDRIIFRVAITSGGTVVSAGTCNLYLYELQSDGTLKSYDFNDNTFKTTALTTETASFTHRTGNNGGTNTGVWTYSHTTLTGFTVGAIYLAHALHSTEGSQHREFQFGSGVLADAVLINGTAASTYTTILSSVDAKLPTSYIMGSSDQSNHDTDIDAIKAYMDTAWTEGTGVPAAGAGLGAKVEFVFQQLRNKVTTTATEQKLHNDAGAAIATAALTEDGTTFTKGEFA